MKFFTLSLLVAAASAFTDCSDPKALLKLVGTPTMTPFPPHMNQPVSIHFEGDLSHDEDVPDADINYTVFIDGNPALKLHTTLCDMAKQAGKPCGWKAGAHLDSTDNIPKLVGLPGSHKLKVRAVGTVKDGRQLGCFETAEFQMIP